MKVLSLIMVLNSMYAFGILAMGMSSGHAETFAKILSIVTMALQAGIIFGMGKWFLNQESRNFLIFGLYANVGMALLTMAIMGMNADSIAAGNLEFAERSVYEAIDLPNTTEDDIQVRDAAIQAAR